MLAPFVGARLTKQVVGAGYSQQIGVVFGEGAGYLIGEIPGSIATQCKAIQPPYKC